MENKDNSRRDFLVAGLATALAAAGCSTKKNPFDKYADDPVSNPHGYTFDPGYNYASLQGIRYFAGMRYTLFKR